MKFAQYILYMVVSLQLGTPSVNAESFFGRVLVLDGDTILMREQRIRLYGIDAPESRQSCWDKSDEIYRCGQISTDQMISYTNGKIVYCEVTDTDRYGRLVAKCSVDGENLSERLVREGWALAHRRREIIEDEASVIRRIFEDYLGGKTARQIAADLNNEGVASPRGGSWNASTINGNKKRRNGILNNELYLGNIIYNSRAS